MSDSTYLVGRPSNSTLNTYQSVSDDDEKNKCSNKYYIPARYIMALWGFFGFWVVFTLRVNLSVAIIAMVNSSAITNNSVNFTSECYFPKPNETKPRDGEFVWSQRTQGIILGAFFWGYIPLQVPAGWIAVKIGGKWLFGIGVLWTSLWTLLTPPAARLGYGWLIALRILEGAGESITYPAMHSMLGHWAPALEITFISAFVYSGGLAGIVFGMITSAFLIEANIMGGWPSVFYIPGTLGIAWFIIWSFVAFSTPAKHPRISQRERKFIEASVNLSHKEIKANVPWKRIFLSVPVWALSVVNFSASWSLYTLLTCLPQYFHYVLGFSITENGLINALPYFLSLVFFMISGKASDFVRTRGWLTTTNTRKLFNSIGMVVNTIFIVAISYIGCDKVLVITFLCIAGAVRTIGAAAYSVNHIDLAPQYAGVLYAITNSIATVSGIVGPYVVGVLTDENETRLQWKYVFFISSGITIFGAIVYLIFGSGERQPWAIENSETETQEEVKEEKK